MNKKKFCIKNIEWISGYRENTGEEECHKFLYFSVLKVPQSGRGTGWYNGINISWYIININKYDYMTGTVSKPNDVVSKMHRPLHIFTYPFKAG